MMLGDDLCVYVCGGEVVGVNVIVSMRLSLIDGQLKSWFPFGALLQHCSNSSPKAAEVIKGLLFRLSVEKSVYWVNRPHSRKVHIVICYFLFST